MPVSHQGVFSYGFFWAVAVAASWFPPSSGLALALVVVFRGGILVGGGPFTTAFVVTVQPRGRGIM